MKRITSVWWLTVLLLLSFLLVACERPLQDEAELEALTPGATTSPAATLEGQETALPGTLPAASPSPAGAEPSPAGEEPTSEGTAPDPTETPAPEATEGRTGEIIHVVVAGDTLFTLSQQYDVSVDEIAAANDMSNIHTLEIGQELVIPAPGGETPPTTEEPAATEEPGAAEERVHVVQPGENLFRIGLQYGFTIEELAAYNNIANPNRLEVGQEILIPPEGWSP